VAKSRQYRFRIFQNPGLRVELCAKVVNQIKLPNGSPTVTIVSYTSPTKVNVNTSQTVGATNISIPGSTVPYPPQLAQWCLVKL
jgi:hypothetical protein